MLKNKIREAIGKKRHCNSTDNVTGDGCVKNKPLEIR